MKHIMNGLDMYDIRLQVFQLFEVPVACPYTDPPHEILMRAHYTYIQDQEFDLKIRELKSGHEKYMATLLENIHLCKDLEDFYQEKRKASGEYMSDGRCHPLDT